MPAKPLGGEIDWAQVAQTIALVFCGVLLSSYLRAARDFVSHLTRGTPAVETDASSEKEKDAKQAEDDEDSDAADEDLGKVKAGLTETCKLVLVVRTDLGMSSGKIAAQCSHATLACYKQLMKSNPSLVRHWERTGQAKIALKIDSEDAMTVLQAQAQSLGICARTIQDAGRTQVAAGSTTVLGIGPAPVQLIDQVTKHLRLL